MKIHKRTRLTLSDREELWKMHCARKYSQSELAGIFRVSRQTISKILQRCRGREFVPRSSVNKRFRSLEYGLKRLKKVEFEIEQRKKLVVRIPRVVYIFSFHTKFAWWCFWSACRSIQATFRKVFYLQFPCGA
jgi:hypothetical protein